MFTGLVESVGTVLAVEERSGSRRIRVAAPGLAEHLQTGSSVAVSGVCLTAIGIDVTADPPFFQADLAAETVARTSLAELEPGEKVNLELPTPAGAPLGGHIVQGHVDGAGILLSLEPVEEDATAGQGDWWLRVSVPPSVSRYMADKGSIAIEGISLTIARFEVGTSGGDVVSVAIIPHTYQATNLHTLRPGRLMNIEADVMMKLASSHPRQSGFEVSVAYLVANGY